MKTTFTITTTGYVYEANETRTYCWRYPVGLKGKRVRINKCEFSDAETMHEQEKILDGMMAKLGYTHIASEWMDVRYSTCDGQSKVMAWNTLEEGIMWAEEALTEKRTAEQEESETTEEVKEIAKELAPKKVRKPRKSKDIAFKTTIALADDRIADVTLTAKQVDFIHHLPDTCFWENGLDSCIWIDCLCDDIGGQFAGKPMTVGAMISTLCEKDLGFRSKQRVNKRTCTAFELTELGKRVAAELGLH